jgi:phosphoketolase
VLACAGDVPTVETVAAAELLKAGAPGLKIRVVNVVDLMRLQDASEHPHGRRPGTSTGSSQRTSPSSSPTTAIRH